MKHEVQLYMTRKEAYDLIFFHNSSLKDIEDIEKVYLVVATEKNSDAKINVSLNSYLSDKDYNQLNICKTSSSYSSHKKDYVSVDITDLFIQIVAGTSYNDGLRVYRTEYILGEYKLFVHYRCGIIVPKICDSCYFDKEIHLFSHNISSATPWILTKDSTIITFFAKNLSNHKMTIRLQNSPDGINFTQDAQIVDVDRRDTGAIVPYLFSKYTRLIILSNGGPIDAKVWFETQLVK